MIERRNKDVRVGEKGISIETQEVGEGWGRVYWETRGGGGRGRVY